MAFADVPEGAFLRLRPGEWSRPAGPPATASVDVSVAKVHAGDTDGKTWVGVSGHKVECGWSPGERHAPCVELLVQPDALRRAVNQATGR